MVVDNSVLEIIKNRLVAAYKPQSLYLFGSYAWGIPNKDSDYDLLVVVNNSDEKMYKRSIKGIKALFGLKIAKDILVYTQDEFNNYSQDVTTLGYKIKQKGIMLYGAV